MTKEEIIEGNKLFAEFLGWKQWQSIYKDKPEDYIFIRPNLKFKLREREMPWGCSLMEFHTSWDWLMPCVGRITNQCEEPEELDGLKYALLTDNIEEAWKICVEFCKYYKQETND